MRVAQAVYRLMEEIAESHAGIGKGERAVLAAYRQALGIDEASLTASVGEDDAELLAASTPAEREAALKAMARVAAVDGKLDPAEESLLLELAQHLELGDLQAANLIAAETLRAKTNARRPLRLALAVASTTLVLLIVAAIASLFGGDDLQVIAREGDKALVLLQVDYSFERDGKQRSFRGEGSGFFVYDDGLIVTCKHVVQPWKFLADRVAMTEDGWSLDADSIRWRAWPAGAQLFSEDGEAAPTEWDTASATLELARMAKDDWVRGERSRADGGSHRGVYHALNNQDLVLLQAHGEVPTGLSLAAPDHKPRRLDEVVVLGFPRGVELLEGVYAVSAPSIGIVKRVEDTVLISSDTFPGNSGGPCLDASGQVIGVVARRAGTERLGRCLRTAHVWSLLE